MKYDADLLPLETEIRPAITRGILNRDQAESRKTALRDISFMAGSKRAEKQIYAFGRIYYRDTYGRPWRTKFCFQWEPWHPFGPRWVTYRYYNDEDQAEFLLPEEPETNSPPTEISTDGSFRPSGYEE